MCHAFLDDFNFYHLLFRIDQSIAEDIRKNGCPCGGVLHRADYPRKPRGIRSVLNDAYCTRLSFCCAEDTCRRRRTPASVRFLGRKVYLGVIVVLVTALQHGLTPKRRRQLVEALEIPPQTLSRWRRWWREAFAQSRCWQMERGHFVPPIEVGRLPDSLLGRLKDEKLSDRLCRLLVLLCPATTTSVDYLKGVIDPQRM